MNPCLSVSQAQGTGLIGHPFACIPNVRKHWFWPALDQFDPPDKAFFATKIVSDTHISDKSERLIRTLLGFRSELFPSMHIRCFKRRSTRYVLWWENCLFSGFTLEARHFEKSQPCNELARMTCALGKSWDVNPGRILWINKKKPQQTIPAALVPFENCLESEQSMKRRCFQAERTKDKRHERIQWHQWTGRKANMSCYQQLKAPT